MQTTPPTNTLRRPVIGRSFGATLAGSLALHAVLVVGYAIHEARKTVIIDLPEEPIKAVFVKLGKPRDKKLLPRKTTAPAPPPPTKNSVAVPTKEAPKDKAIVPKEEDKEEPEDRKLSALDRIREQVERDKAKENALNRIAERVGEPDEEEEGQEDGRPDGTSPTASQINSYFGTVAASVQRLWNVPSVLQTGGECARLKAAIMVRIGPDGTVTQASIARTSGNQLFDSAMLATIKQASPLPPPPPNMRDFVGAGVAMQFRCDK